jgi:DNA-binding Lrp family transcriptional regulator
MREDGILYGFSVLVNPNFYGKYYGFAAFKNIKDYSEDWIFFKLKCFEWLNVYGIEGNSIEDIKDKISYMSKDLGEIQMTYIPEQEMIKPNQFDVKILPKLLEDPRAQPSDIAEKLKLPSKLVAKRLKIMESKGYIKVIPNINIPKSGSVVFSMFSTRIKDIRNILEECRFMEITDMRAGIQICFAESMEEAKKYINAVRTIDKQADVMLIYDYYVKVADIK